MSDFHARSTGEQGPAEPEACGASLPPQPAAGHEPVRESVRRLGAAYAKHHAALLHRLGK
ncbi:hypothetical protein [Streptomyces yaizuensis]|uniref:MarR family transcriptional regulator n=1 Tax=Streptomyces yaizuensis TaxID=2989713 RepID=A0ABQ5NSW2_9ACTN|nr:hypothetical protein [Streptomyces sp. YSPA8]GLF93462.1 hypothetical protein SYYSPA8_04215 [Streptomyces sp. YSPA8]